MLPSGGRAGRWLLPAQIALALTALVLAMVGYERAGAGPWWDNLYRSIALFTGDTSSLGAESALVTLARWLALAVTTSAVVAVTLAVLGRTAGGLVTRRLARDHVVVAGDGPDAARIAASMLTGDTRVVLVSANADLAGAVTRRVVFVHGSPSDARALRAARADRAAAVVVAMTDDASTTHAALVAADVANRGRVIGLLRDPVARSLLQERILGRGGHVVELVSLPEIAARRAVADMAQSGPPARAAAIVGEGPLAEALAMEAARSAPPGDAPLRLYVDASVRARLAGVHRLAGLVEIIALEDSEPRALAALLGTRATHCYLCPPASIGDALALAGAGGPALRVLLLIHEASADVARAATQTLDEIGDGRVRVIDVNAGVYGSDLLSFGMIEEIARAKHAQYLRDQSAARAMGSDPAMREWEELGADLQRANRDFARGVAEHLARSGRRLVPDPTLGTSHDVPPIFSDDEIEELARAEHERWMRDRAAAGWVYGAVRDDERKHHPDMRPWEELDEPARAKDREPMRDLARILASAGLRAERITHP